MVLDDQIDRLFRIKIFIYFLKKDLLIREYVHKQGGAQRERNKQTLCWVGLDPQTLRSWRSQTLDQLSHPGTPKIFERIVLLEKANGKMVIIGSRFLMLYIQLHILGFYWYLMPCLYSPQRMWMIVPPCVWDLLQFDSLGKPLDWALILALSLSAQWPWTSYLFFLTCGRSP